jgi:dipeptidyl aminopeptidase/acylaminoacyl peptidase
MRLLDRTSRMWSAGALAAIAVASPARSAEATALPKPEAFVQRATASAPMISPDGKTLVTPFLGSKQVLCVAQITNLDGGCVREIPADATNLSWLGNDKLLSGWGVRVVLGDFALTVGGFSTIDLATGKQAPLLPAKSPYIVTQALWAAPDGSRIVLLAQKRSQSWPEVIALDMATGAVTQVQPPKAPVSAWFTDGEGVVRAGVGYDGRKIVIVYRDKPGEPLRTAPSPPIPKSGEEVEDILESIRFDGPGGSKLAISNRKTGRFAVYEYDPATDTLGKPLFEHPAVDIDTLVMDPATRTVAGIAYEDDRPRVKWLQPEQAALQAQVDRVFPKTVNMLGDRSRDGNLIIVETRGPDSDDMFYLFDRKTRRMEGLLPGFADRTTLQLSPVRSYGYQARDGLAIPAYLTLPIGRPAKKLPLIVMPHGGPFARDHWDYDPYVQFLASRGYAVLQPEFRGSTGYGRSFVEKGYGQWGAAMQDDLLDGIDALAKEGVIDPQRVCIMGASYGGYAAEWAAARDHSRYRCAVSLAGVSDLRATLRHDSSQFYAKRYAAEWRKRVQGEEKRDLAAFSPLQQQASISIPLLIAHGEADETVPASQSHQLFKALQKRGAVVEGYFYPHEGHGLSEPKNVADFLTHVEAFLSKYNPS